MQASDVPVKFSIPFANGAGGSYVRTIPVNSQIGIQDGAASLTDGFPPLTFIPVGSGGVPPFGADMNGILKEITQWTRWSNAGGTVAFDNTFCTLIGGYPAGALLRNAAGNGFWLCTADNNTNNPDATPTGWMPIIVIGSSAQPLFEGTAAAGTATPYAREDHVHPNDYCGVSTGTANAQIIGVPHGLAALVDGVTLSFIVGPGLSNTGAATLQVGTGGGALGPLSIVKDSPAGPIALVGGELVAGNRIGVQVRSTAFHLVNVAQGSVVNQNVSRNTGKVPAVAGTVVNGNVPIFDTTDGTIRDSGVSPGSLATGADGVMYQLGRLF
jgi:hypothetical protein